VVKTISHLKMTSKSRKTDCHLTSLTCARYLCWARVVLQLCSKCSKAVTL